MRGPFSLLLVASLTSHSVAFLGKNPLHRRGQIIYRALALSEENVEKVLNEAKLEIGTMFGK